MTTVSVCSFTYNDANLLHGFLADIAGWSSKPDEIVLVDDGSSVPFALLPEEEAMLPPVKLIRLHENKGFTIAKHTAISAAAGEVILSVDSDSRLSPGFLEACIEHLKDRSVGLVSGIYMAAVGYDLLSRYIRPQLTEVRDIHAPFETDFINGGAFALRREVWNETGGFSGHPESRGQDHYLCKSLKKLGYKLLLDPAHEVREARKLDRHALYRRTWAWCGESLAQKVTADETLPEHLQACLHERICKISKISGTDNLVFLL